MAKKVTWHEMFKDEFESAVAERPVCYMPYGLSEPHGLQNAMGLDGLKAYALVIMAAERHGGVVAPPVWWHVHETPHGREWLSAQNAPRPCLTSITAEILLHQMVYQLRAAEAAGFKCAICLTGHYGGIQVDMKQVCAAYSSRRPLRAAALSDPEAISYKDYRGDHAGICETSQLWALRPDMVDISRIPGDMPEGRFFASDRNAKHSSRREGERIVESQVGFLKRLSDRLLEDAENCPPGEHISIEEAEDIWRLILEDKPNWISSRPAEGFKEYLEKRRKLFPLPLS